MIELLKLIRWRAVGMIIVAILLPWVIVLWALTIIAE
jgi:hypothetical protein